MQGTGPRSSRAFCLGALQAPLGNMPFVTVISPLTDEDTKGGEVGHSPQDPGLVEPELGLTCFIPCHVKPWAPSCHASQEQRGPGQRGLGNASCHSRLVLTLLTGGIWPGLDSFLWPLATKAV